MEVDVVEVFVEVDISCMLCGASERKMKSGMALVRGSKIPRLPTFKLSCVMRRV